MTSLPIGDMDVEYARTVSDRAFRAMAEHAVPATSGTTYNDTGLSPSTQNSYRIAAVDTSNNVSTSTSGVSAEN
jgi:hypothetical protein